MKPPTSDPNCLPTFNPWPYGVTAFLCVFFALVVSFGVFAVRQRVDLVRTDYYEEDLRYGKQYDRLRRTRDFSQEVDVRHAPATQQISLTLPITHAGGGTQGSIQLYRPSDARLDQEIPLAVNTDGRQILDASKLRPGLWKVRVTWKSGGAEYFHATTLVIPPHVAALPVASPL